MKQYFRTAVEWQDAEGEWQLAEIEGDADIFFGCDPSVIPASLDFDSLEDDGARPPNAEVIKHLDRALADPDDDYTFPHGIRRDW